MVDLHAEVCGEVSLWLSWGEKIRMYASFSTIRELVKDFS